ncbi:MAG: hypothetical protein ACXAEU_03160 [Candidatus Hodarchaeales archaeon]|jgi:hypothetical protein
MEKKLKLSEEDYEKLEGNELIAIMREKYEANPPPPQVDTSSLYDVNLIEILGSNRSVHQMQLFGQLKQFIKEFNLEKAVITLLKLEKLEHVTMVNDFWKLTAKGRDFFDNL